MMFLQPRSNGFTLIELIATFLILGIMSSFALPPLSRQLQNERLNSATKTLAAWIDDQRKRAIQQSSPCDLEFNLTDASISSECDNDSDSTFQTLNLRDQLLNSDTLILSITEGAKNWTFTPRGTTIATAEVQLSFEETDELGRCIRLTAPLGLIRSARQNREGKCDYTTAF